MPSGRWKKGSQRKRVIKKKTNFLLSVCVPMYVHARMCRSEEKALSMQVLGTESRSGLAASTFAH